MTDHLPECDKHALVPRAGWVCICDALRACEQRVTSKVWDASGVSTYRVGYAAGIKAAREAVEVCMPYPWADPQFKCLAAIDALRDVSE